METDAGLVMTSTLASPSLLPFVGRRPVALELQSPPLTLFVAAPQPSVLGGVRSLFSVTWLFTASVCLEPLEIRAKRHIVPTANLRTYLLAQLSFAVLIRQGGRGLIGSHCCGMQIQYLRRSYEIATGPSGLRRWRLTPFSDICRRMRPWGDNTNNGQLHQGNS
jgi:hypothetical protein